MKKITWMVAVLIVVLSVGVTFAGWFSEDTVGERFRKAIAKIRKDCASRTLDRGEVCGVVAELKPADPLATEEGRFAHSIVIPNPLPADSGYKPGMTSQEYFDHLCKTEAGEFIYKTIDNVDGLFMLRSRSSARDEVQEHLYALEDPYGHMDAEAEEPEMLFVRPQRYAFLEHPLWSDVKPPWGQDYMHPSYSVPPDKAARYERFFGADGRDPKSMVKQYDSERKARYGYTWRGITRPYDRELGIAGGELIVLDLENNEVLGVRRGFIRSGAVPNNATGIWWMTGHACPRYASMGGRRRDIDFAYWFVSQVLKPARHEQRVKELNDVK
ncbi:MAG: hypothetical protein U0172_03370 [Nitrospiraceae bacterium]